MATTYDDLTPAQKIEILSRRVEEWDRNELIGFIIHTLRDQYKEFETDALDYEFSFFFEEDEIDGQLKKLLENDE